jgi:hypothetical protein
MARRHGSAAENRPVALVVLAEHVRGEVVTATMSLATFGVDLYFHCLVPICVVVVSVS